VATHALVRRVAPPWRPAHTTTRVALLETEIGVRLLDRGRGGLRLTHAGELLLEHADHVAWRLQLADSQITDLAKQHRGVTTN
jgi:DNA-binding transcriptional LysR family regulator